MRPFSQGCYHTLENLTHDVPFGSRLLYLRGRDVRIDLEAVLPQYSLDQKSSIRLIPLVNFLLRLSVFFQKFIRWRYFLRGVVLFCPSHAAVWLSKYDGEVNLFITVFGCARERLWIWMEILCYCPQPDMLSMVCALTTLLQEKKWVRIKQIKTAISEMPLKLSNGLEVSVRWLRKWMWLSQRFKVGSNEILFRLPVKMIWLQRQNPSSWFGNFCLMLCLRLCLLEWSRLKNLLRVKRIRGSSEKARRLLKILRPIVMRVPNWNAKS